jgi:outer membrane protein assembly factor BamD
MSILKTSRLVPAPPLLALLVTSVFAGCGGGGMTRYQGMTPEQLFQIAETELAEGDHDEAVRVLDRLLLAHGDWSRVPEARLMLGHVYFDNEDYLTARAEYQRFLDRYAGHPRSPEAALGTCRALARLAPTPQRDQTYTQEAITSCRNVVIDYAGSDASAEAARISNDLRHTLAEKDFLNAEFYFRRNLFDAAIKYYEFVANLYPESEFAPRALLGLYHSNRAIGYDDLAEEARQRLLDRYPESQAAAEIRADGSNG